MRPLRECMLLYVVTDRTWLAGKTLSSQVEEVLKAGATCVQLREKELPYAEFLREAESVKAVASKYGVPFIINDNIEVAIACGADGVHVGQGDMPVKEARNRIGQDKILGVSAQTVEQAVQAERDGADYIGVGAVFPTATKPDADAVSCETLKKICGSVGIPVVAIGGITAENIHKLSGSGIDGAAVVSAIFASPSPAEATRQMLEAIRKTVRPRFKGAIFDLDGTLIDSMPVWRHLGRDYLKLHGIKAPKDIQETLKTMSLLESAEYFQREFSIPQSVEEVIEGIKSLAERQYRESVPLKPHALPFLQKLKAQGVKCCVVTANHRHLAEAALSRLGVLEYFEFILTCTDTGTGKDDPHVFLTALSMLGTGIGETMVFEDALHAVCTAKAAGFRVTGVYDPSADGDAEAIRETADCYIRSFEEWGA